MPKLCLNCFEKSNRRQGGECPVCGEEVRIWRDYFIPETANNPGEDVLKAFIKKVREIRQIPAFDIPKKSPTYRREIKSAIELWERCRWEIDFAEAVIHRALTHKDYRWKNWTSLTLLTNSSELWIIISEVQRERDAEELDRMNNENAINSISQREDIFGSN